MHAANFRTSKLVDKEFNLLYDARMSEAFLERSSAILVFTSVSSLSNSAIFFSSSAIAFDGLPSYSSGINNLSKCSDE